MRRLRFDGAAYHIHDVFGNRHTKTGAMDSQYRKKSFIKPLKRHRHSTTITCRYFITIVTGFQQNIALKQSRCLTVAQPAAKWSIRADLPFARQSKKKCGIFYEPGMRNGNKPADGLLWYPRRAVFDTSHQKRPCARFL